MALDATKWQVTAGKAIEYTGPAHGLTGANYVTVLELHRWLQDLADAESISGDDYMSITIANPTDKKFDTIIQLLNGFTLGTTTIPTAADNAAATIAALIEGGLTLQDVLRIVLAVTSGDATGLEGASMAFKSVDGTKDRVLATYATGTRNVTALDPT